MHVEMADGWDDEKQKIVADFWQVFTA